MKTTIKVGKEVELKTLEVRANVRYWENTEVNSEADTDGTLMPCREGGLWCPVIDLDSGQILNWEKGKSANVHYKVCDEGIYYLKDNEGNVVLSIEEDYVPKMMCPKENGYGDYIIMDIDGNGFIQDWEQTLEGFTKYED